MLFREDIRKKFQETASTLMTKEKLWENLPVVKYKTHKSGYTQHNKICVTAWICQRNKSAQQC